MPATVRYDRAVLAGAKLLYMELSALAKKNGACGASNGYFSKLYAVDASTVSKWVKSLADAGHIRVRYGLKKDGVKFRKIALVFTRRKARPPASTGGIEISQYPIDLNQYPIEMDGGDPAESPGFWSVTPATVRYDKAVPPGAKLLYGELSALVKKTGVCTASNGYFSKLYAVDASTVSKWVKSLAGAGHIRVKYGLKKDGVKFRKITLVLTRRTAHKALPPRASPERGIETTQYPIDLNHYPIEKTQGGIEISPSPIEKTPHRSIQRSITTATAAPPSEAKPFPDEKAAAAAADFLKHKLIALDRALVFDRTFYPRAVLFMYREKLDDAFLAWLREHCLTKKPRSLNGLFFTLFFADGVVELYRLSCAAQDPPQPKIVSCPACGAQYPGREDVCPSCNLSRAAGRDEIIRHKKFLALPAGKKDEYEKRRNAVINANIAFPEKMKKIQKISEEFFS
jgi:DNA-binding MarR family transcriptional regulator